MGLKDCLVSAADQGAITRLEAQELSNLFDERFAQGRLQMGDAPAISAAKKSVEDELRKMSIEKKRRADLTEAARLTIKGRLQQAGTDYYTTAKAILSHYGFRDGSSVRGRAEAIMINAHAQVSDVMFAYRRSGILGRRENAAMLPDFVKELHGENSGDATAKELARSVSKVFEDLRQRFNAAGGAIGKLEGFGLPHTHDRLKVKAAGLDAWKAEMLSRIDPAKMKDALTGAAISPQRLDQALNDAYANIVSDGAASLQPTMARTGLGSIASQRAEERFFVFKDAQSWMDYNRNYGRGDVVQAVFNHINGMAKDIGAMELLGPNPAAMVEWLKQVVKREYGLRDAGKPNMAKPGMILPLDQGKMAEAYLGWLYTTLRGNPTVSNTAANFTAGVKNVAMSATLGATSILAAVTDPFIARAGRKLAGIPAMKNAGNIVSMISKQSRDDIVRSGVMWEEYTHVMADELRWGGTAMGAEWTRWLADRTVTWNGLKPLTTGRKMIEARAWQAHIADLAKDGTAFAKLDPRFKRALDGFGVTENDWKIWTSSIDANGFVTPAEIIKNGGDVSYLNLAKVPMTDPARLVEEKALRFRATAEKLTELTTSWSERSVPTGTPNARAAVSAGVQRGTIPGELLSYFTQFKGFGLSFTANQLEAMAEMASHKGGGKGLKTAAAYMASLAIPLAIGGGVYIQLKHLLDGQDPEPLDGAFAAKAIITGGGFGLFGDFVKSTENRFGQTMTDALAGPGLALIGDAFNTAYALALQPDQRAAKGRQFAQRWTPILSSHPATRLAYNRVVLDNMEWATNAKALKSFKSKAQKARRAGSPFWLPPGSLTGASRSLSGSDSLDLGTAFKSRPKAGQRLPRQQ